MADDGDAVPLAPRDHSMLDRALLQAPNSFCFTVASTSDDADQTRAAVVCERLLGRQGAQPFAEADDLGTIRGAFRRNQPITQTGSLIDPVAAIARMVAKIAGYQQVDLAFDQFMQAGGLQHPQTDFRVPAAKLRQFEAAQAEAAMDPQLQQHRTCRFQLRGRLRDATKAVGYPGQIGLTGRGQDELLMQPLEQAYAEARL